MSPGLHRAHSFYEGLFNPFLNWADDALQHTLQFFLKLSLKWSWAVTFTLSPVADFSVVLMTLLSESFSWQFSKGKRRVLYSISITWVPFLLTASALQIFIDIIMPPLAIIYPSGNSTSLSILPHKSTPPAPVIISLLFSELSSVCWYLNKVPKLKAPLHPGTKAITWLSGVWHMLKRRLGLVDVIVELSSYLMCGHFSPPQCFLYDCCLCAPSLPTFFLDYQA